MLYVLEGCDGSGKTTLAKQLSKLLDADIIHCSQHTPNNYNFFDNIITASHNKNIIADRFCYGQFVYQSDGDRPLGDISTLNVLETRLLKENAKVIYVSAPDEVIKERLAMRGESLINGLTVEEIRIKFSAVRKLSLLTWLDYNTGGVV